MGLDIGQMTEETESVNGQSDECIQPMGKTPALGGRMFRFQGDITRWLSQL